MKKDKYLGLLKVDEIVENKDGSATIYFSDITKELKKAIRQYYGKKRFSQKIFKAFVIEGIVNYTSKIPKKELKKVNNL